MSDSLKTRVIIIAIVAVFIFVILWRFNIIKFKTQDEKKDNKTKAEAKAEKKVIVETINTDKFFKPKTWQETSISNLLDENDARKKAETLYKAIKGAGTNETKIFGVFRSLTSPYQVSQLSFFYLANYGKDLVTDLTDDLNKKTLQQVYDIVEAL